CHYTIYPQLPSLHSFPARRSSDLPQAAAVMIDSTLAATVVGSDAMLPGRAWSAMQATIRNAGRQGVGAMAVSAVDIALWDLKARSEEHTSALQSRFDLVCRLLLET